MGLTPDQQLLRQKDKELADAMTLAAELRDRGAYNRLTPDRFPEADDAVGQLILNLMAESAVQNLYVQALMREGNITNREQVDRLHAVRKWLSLEEEKVNRRFNDIEGVSLPEVTNGQSEKLRGYWPSDPYLKNLQFLQDHGVPEAMNPDTMAAARILPPEKLAREQLLGAGADIARWEMARGVRVTVERHLKERGMGLPTEKQKTLSPDQTVELEERLKRYEEALSLLTIRSVDQAETVLDTLVRLTGGELGRTTEHLIQETSEFPWHGEGTA